MFLHDIGIIPGRHEAGETAGGRSQLTNLSRRGFVTGSGLFVLGVTLAGCSNYVEPNVDADAFDIPKV